MVQKQLTQFFCNNFLENLFSQQNFKGEMLEGDYQDIVDAIKNRKADIGFVDQVVQSDSIDYFHVRIEKLCLLVNPTNFDFSLENNNQITWENIPNGTLFLSSHNDTLLKKVKQSFDLHNISHNKITRMDSLDIITSCVEKGIQSAIVPSHYINGNEKLQNLCIIPISQPDILISIGIITPRGTLNRKRISKILNCPIENVENNFYGYNKELMNMI